MFIQNTKLLALLSCTVHVRLIVMFVFLSHSPWYNHNGWLGVKHQVACFVKLYYTCSFDCHVCFYKSCAVLKAASLKFQSSICGSQFSAPCISSCWYFLLLTWGVKLASVGCTAADIQSFVFAVFHLPEVRTYHPDAPCVTFRTEPAVCRFQSTSPNAPCASMSNALPETFTPSPSTPLSLPPPPPPHNNPPPKKTPHKQK